MGTLAIEPGSGAQPRIGFLAIEVSIFPDPIERLMGRVPPAHQLARAWLTARRAVFVRWEDAWTVRVSRAPVERLLKAHAPTQLKHAVATVLGALQSRH